MTIRERPLQTPNLTTAELLSHLRSLDVRLWLDEGRLRYSAPNGVLTPALRAALAAHKTEISDLLGQAQATIDDLPSIRPVSRDELLPPSFAQQRLWFLDQLAPGNTSYNVSLAIRLEGTLNLAALKQTLNAIVRRHEILRTTFPMIDGRPIQAIAPALMLAVPLVDLQVLVESRRKDEVQRLAAAEAQQPFDLARGPLLRVTLLQLSQTEYVALFTMHHIISDAWSLQVLVREVVALYDAFASEHALPLPELSIQYADFAAWQRQWLQGEVLEKQLAYWKQQLAGSPPVLELPADRPRPVVQTFRGAVQTFTLSSDLSKALQALSHQEGATLFMTLLAAFQTLLHRYSGQDDILVGSPIANRNHLETEKMIGFFVNTLVLRTDFSGDPTFRQLLRQVRDVALAAYAHQDLPFDYLVDELKPERALSYTPLFQVAFQLQNVRPQETFELPGLTLSSFAFASATAKFDLALAIVEAPDKLTGSLEYNTDLFDDATISRMLGHFKMLLSGIVAHPEQRISLLPLLTGPERQQLLVAWNGATMVYPREQCVQDLFEAQAALTPEAVALSYEGQQLSYRALNQRANQLAHTLQQLNVGPEVVVGICVERSLEMVAGLLGILKAGGAYLPLDPAYPQERLAYMLQDSRTSVLLTQQHLLDYLLASDLQSLISNPQIICLDSDWHVIARQPDTNPRRHSTAANLAYVIYTSGSTGKPKGVAVQHAGLMNLVAWHQQTYDVTPADRATQLAALAFDASVWELWPYLTAGASVHMPNEATRTATVQLVEWLAAENITLSFLPTPLAEAVLEEPWPPDVALRALLTGGDKLHRGPRRDLSFTLVNHYGPTEYTVVTTWTPVAPGAESEGAPSIGRPLPNTQLYVLSNELQPVPVSVPGELYIGGDGLARGYLNRPDLTAGRFIPNPFSDRPGARLYRTGDLVCYRPDGNLEFLGRIDHQVKVRGFRIELGEVEAALDLHPAVREVVLLARGDESGSKRLVAYLVSNQDPPPAAGQLRLFLKETLPEYMVPAAFVWLEALPLTPNGKVDRRALPAPEPARPELTTGYVAPRTPAEEALAGIWRQVLGLEQVGVADNFFELGGDSMRIIQVTARARQANITLTPAQLFQYPTIAGLAEVVGTAQTVQPEQGIITGSTPLTPIQRWFFEQPFTDRHHWNWAFLRQVPKLDPALLAQTVRHLLSHHDALRLRFQEAAAGWQAVSAAPEAVLPFVVIDLSTIDPQRQRQSIETAAVQLQTSLNLANGPLLRIAYFDLGAGPAGRVLIIFHHLVVDVISTRILMEDMQTILRQLQQHRPVQLPAKTTAFQTWSRRLFEYAQSSQLRQEVEYWLEALTGEVAPLPLDFPDGVNSEASAALHVEPLPAETTQALLHALPAVIGVPVQEALLAALVQTFARWTGVPSLLLEIEGHGREYVLDGVDLSRTVGWFTSIYPIRLDLSRARRPADALQAVRARLQRVPNRGIGYGLLRYLCQDEDVRQQMAALPRAEVNFNYLGQLDQEVAPATPFRSAPEHKGPERSLSSRRIFPLYIVASVRGGILRMHWNYSANLHQPHTIAGLAEAFNEELRTLVTIPLKSEESRNKLTDSERAAETRQAYH